MAFLWLLGLEVKGKGGLPERGTEALDLQAVHLPPQNQLELQFT